MFALIKPRSSHRETHRRKAPAKESGRTEPAKSSSKSARVVRVRVALNEPDAIIIRPRPPVTKMRVIATLM